MAVKQDFATEHNLKTISDLVALASSVKLTFSAPVDFEERDDGLKGLHAVYGDFPAEVNGVAPGIKYQALLDGDANVVLAFSTDVSAFGKGAYLVSLTPYSEVERVVDWAMKDGVNRFAMLGPDNANGRTIEQALRQEVTERGGQVVSVEYYTPGNSSPQAEARRTASVIDAQNKAYPGKVAVLIPESGVQLRSVGALLRAIATVTPREVRFLGTGQWNDPDVWREPGLYGGAFPAPDPTALQDFEKRYMAIYGEAAPRLASFGYDAGALAATLAGADRLDAGMIQRPQGWSGVNGLFRFMADGSVERALAIMQLQDRGGAKIVSPPIQEFAAGS